MLKLSRMELSGFKSFYQKTRIDFPDGITAVVGPNGCGKSNISDAISWVLGAQSSKALRGARMEDVIFNGSEKRGPLALAEVTLSLTWSGNAAAAGNGNGHGHDAAAADNGSGLATTGDESDTFHPKSGVFAAATASESDTESAAATAVTAIEVDSLQAIAAPETTAAGAAAEADIGDSGQASAAAAKPPYALPTQAGESVSVTRRLFRNGDSEYRINGSRCRLKDILDLMRSAAIGSRTYAIIEQDRIISLLSARPKERKEMIEEAAGILGFKSRRRAALLKLESTEGNLSRLRDLVAEIRRQANSLRRQAAAARRFRRTAESIRRHRRILFHLEHAALVARNRELAARAALLAEVEAAAAAALAREEARVQALRQRIEEDGQGAGNRRDELHTCEREVDRLEAGLTALAERIAEAGELSHRRREEAAVLADRSRSALAERSHREDERQRDAAQVEQLERRYAEIEERYTSLLTAADEASQVAEDKRSRLLAAVGRLGEARNLGMQLAERGLQLGARRGRLERESEAVASEDREAGSRLQAAAARAEEVASSAAAAVAAFEVAENARQAAAEASEHCRETLAEARHDLAGLLEREAALAAVWDAARPDSAAGVNGPPLGQDVEVTPEWEAAAGAWLENLLQARLVPDTAAALDEMARARERGDGRVRLVVEELLAAPDSTGLLTLAQVLRGDGRRARLLAAAAGDPELVPDLDTAMRRWREAPGRARLTPAGEGISVTGVITGGGRGASSGFLACNRQRREASEAGAAGRAALPGLENELAAARRSLEDAAARCEMARMQRESRAQELLEARLMGDKHQEEQQRLARRAQVLAEEERLLEEDEEAHRLENAVAITSEATALASKGEAEADSQSTQTALDDLRQKIHTLSNERAERKSEFASRRAALTAAEQDVVRLGEEAQALADRGEECGAEARDLTEKAASLQVETATVAAQRQERLQAAVLLRQRCLADEMSLQESRGAVAVAEEKALHARQALDEARQALQAKEVELARVAADLEHLVRECREEFHAEPEALEQEMTDEDRAEDPSSVRQELERLEAIRDRIGPVNMIALEQFQEVEERETFLASQQADLEESIRSLNATIQKINRTTRERFLAALEAIRIEFNRIFRELFTGGHADIVLQEPDDVLESGVEIIAQPPGKRTRNINLLSGGEKSLSAIALLFAIFRYRPSPFCLLDEVDAALDEANVERFTRLLQQYEGETQFILITHNRNSMRVADAMYGVTMEEPGVSQTVSMEMVQAGHGSA